GAIVGEADAGRLCVVGHSYGGATTLGIAETDSRCKAAVALAPGCMTFFRDDMMANASNVACPTLVVGAEFDEVVFVDTFAWPAFQKFPPSVSKLYVEIARAEH